MATDLKATIHIFPLSRVVNAPAGNWVKLLDQIEEGKRNAFAYYLPMREAVVRYCARGGHGFDDILSQMVRRAEGMPCAPRQDICGDNESALRSFVEDFYPRIGKYKGDLLREHGNGVMYEGIVVTGSPHFVAQDRDGKTRYVFLHASNWSTDDLKTYLQLLAMIVDKKYGADTSHIWGMDLKRGKDIKFKDSPRVLSRCANAAKLYARLAKVMTSN
jgi:hypothetical protein